MTHLGHTAPRALACALTLAALAATPVAGAQQATPRTPAPPGGFGALAFDVSVGRGLTLAKLDVGVLPSILSEPLLVRLGAGFSLGNGVWIEGGMRGALDPELAGVHALAVTAGLRIDTSQTAAISLSLRFGYDGLIAGPVSNGGYAAVALNLRPLPGVTLFVEGCAELWPAASVEPANANGQSVNDNLAAAMASYLGGLRVSL